jgi:hypothetical protein
MRAKCHLLLTLPGTSRLILFTVMRTFSVRPTAAGNSYVRKSLCLLAEKFVVEMRAFGTAPAMNSCKVLAISTCLNCVSGFVRELPRMKRGFRALPNQ